jgi:hypothetical protein
MLASRGGRLGQSVRHEGIYLRGSSHPGRIQSCHSVADHQGFVDDEPHQPTAKGALAIKCCDMSSGPVETIVYSNSGLIRIAKHAVCDEMEQAATSLSATLTWCVMGFVHSVAYPQF